MPENADAAPADASPGPEPDWRRNFHAVWPALFATSMGLMAVLPMLPLYVDPGDLVLDPTVLSFRVLTNCDKVDSFIQCSEARK